MANGHRKGLFRSPAALFVAFVTLLGLTGLVTAFWFTETTIEGNVQTGNVGLQWWSAGTDDDGFFDNDSSGSDADDLCGGPAEAWDAHEAEGCDPETQYLGSSADPAEPYPYGGNETLARYDKDVGRCWAEPQGDRLAFSVENGYPSYHCTVEGQLVGGGGVPVVTAGLTVGEFVKYTNFGWTGPGGQYDGHVCYDEGGDFYWGNDASDWDQDCEAGYDELDGDFTVTQNADEVPLDVTDNAGALIVSDGGEHELTLWVHDSCGVQIDPYFGEGEPEDIATYKVSVHVEEDADPDSQYVMYLYPRGVNWNEFGDLDPQCGIFFD